jgi:hypothetical protein
MKSRFILTLGLLALLLAACQPAATPDDPNFALTAAVETAFAQINVPSETPALTETPGPHGDHPAHTTCAAGHVQTSLLKPHDIPRNYVTNDSASI